MPLCHSPASPASVNLHHAHRLTEAGKQPEHRQQDTIKQTERHSLFLCWSIDAKQKEDQKEFEGEMKESEKPGHSADTVVACEQHLTS